MNFHGQFIERFITWSRAQPSIIGVAVVGSCARGTARPDSDIDFVVLCKSPELFLENQAWIHDLGTVVKASREDYGALVSLRVFYAEGQEAEFGLTSRTWASLPVDSGTKEVVENGFRILYDPEDLFCVLESDVIAST